MTARAAPASCVLAPAAEMGHPAKGAIWLEVNGGPRRRGDLEQLIWKAPETIAGPSGLFEPKRGDLIRSGTPAGVGPAKHGDRLRGGAEGVDELLIEAA